MRRGLRGRATDWLGSPNNQDEDLFLLEVEELLPIRAQVRGSRQVEGADVVLPDQGQVGLEDQGVVLLLLRRLRHRPGRSGLHHAGGVEL